MRICQTCGQKNAEGSNFCRFCGVKLSRFENVPQRQPYEKKPPRPYSWKTDELKVKESSTRKTGQIDRVRPLGSFENTTSPINQDANQALQPNRYPGDISLHGYRCPRCATQLLPHVKKKISTAGWTVFAILLIAFFPLFWIGFMLKEEITVCPVCGIELRVSN